jgi:hypothetical protein
MLATLITGLIAGPAVYGSPTVSPCSVSCSKLGTSLLSRFHRGIPEFNRVRLSWIAQSYAFVGEVLRAPEALKEPSRQQIANSKAYSSLAESAARRASGAWLRSLPDLRQIRAVIIAFNRKGTRSFKAPKVRNIVS